MAIDRPAWAMPVELSLVKCMTPRTYLRSQVLQQYFTTPRTPNMEHGSCRYNGVRVHSLKSTALTVHNLGAQAV